MICLFYTYMYVMNMYIAFVTRAVDVRDRDQVWKWV